jgi:hypothetical protein
LPALEARAGYGLDNRSAKFATAVAPGARRRCESTTMASLTQSALHFLASGVCTPPINCERWGLPDAYAEAALRRVALGRSNFLFVANEDSGHDFAVLYTLVASCEKHGIEPIAYLTDVLTRVHTHPTSRVEDLLPHRWKARDAPA